MVLRAVCVSLLIGVLWGCVHMPDSQSLELESVVSYLDLKRRVMEMPGVDRKVMRDEVVNRLDAAPTPANKIRLAIVLSGPGATSEDYEVAGNALRQALRSTAELSAPVQDFVNLSLAEIENNAAIERKLIGYKLYLRDLEIQSSTAGRSNRQLEAEIKRKNSELSDLRQKIRELTYIERSIERSNQEVIPDG